MAMSDLPRDTVAPESLDPTRLYDSSGLRPRRTLEHAALERGQAEGVAIESLEAGDVVVVRTQNSTYRVEVLDPARREVLLSGGAYFGTPTEVRLGGATAGGSTLKVGWIGVGLQLEIACGRQRTTTSCVESVRLENAT
jgi:hypothetical protein